MKKTLFTLMIAIGALVCSPSFGQSATTPGTVSPNAKVAPMTASPTVANDKTVAADAKDPMVYVTKSGKSYHTKDCQFAKNGTPMKLSEASKKYTACSKCKPPVAANAAAPAPKKT